jgi:hypothetical protein
MDAVTKAYSALSDLSLWLKLKNNDQLKLSDMPILISLRLEYIFENWRQIKTQIMRYSDSYEDVARLTKELDLFDEFVSSTRDQSVSIKQNINNQTLISKYYTVFDNIYVNDIAVSPIEQKLIDSEKKRVSSFTKTSFVDMRNNLIAGRDAVADTIGGTDATYNEVYKRGSLPQLLSKSIGDIVFSYQFQNGVFTIDAVLANETLLNSTAYIDPFAFARANANNPDIDIRSYASGTLTRLNYGESLQTLASRTMGDADRWLEIAIANGLKPPYIDEVGDKIQLIANGKDNTINIAGVDALGRLNKDKIFINQIVILQSNTNTQPDQRVIESIKEIPVSGELVIQLSGESNLDQYLTEDQANIRVFLKNTVNSNFYVLIPSDTPLPTTLNKPEPWFLRSKSEDEKNAGVDILIGDGGDIVFTPSGDLKLSYGVDNALQALKILLATEAGSLSRHPEYGVLTPVGSKNFNIDQIKRFIAESIANQVLNDSRFERLDNLTVEYLGSKGSSASGYLISLGVVLAGGGNTVIPISFSVNVPQ